MRCNSRWIVPRLASPLHGRRRSHGPGPSEKNYKSMPRRCDVLAAASMVSKHQRCSFHSLALARFKSAVISMCVSFNESAEEIEGSGCGWGHICARNLFGEMTTFMPVDSTPARSRWSLQVSVVWIDFELILSVCISAFHTWSYSKIRQSGWRCKAVGGDRTTSGLGTKTTPR